jgi:predicted nucleic acid-binding protein
MAQYLIDTNVLLRLVVPTGAQYSQAIQAVKTLLSRGDELFLAPQVVMEFWSVATRPRDVNGYGWSTTEAEVEVAKLLAQFPILTETPAVFSQWLRLVGLRGTVGKQVHDAHIVAVLNAHNVAHLLTFNVADFSGYGINAVSPAEIA